MKTQIFFRSLVHSLVPCLVFSVASAVSTSSCKDKSEAGTGDKPRVQPQVPIKPVADGMPSMSEPNEPPSLELPAYDRVGVGQEIGFGLEVVDLESDEFTVELVGHPASATYDPYTLTVVWKPTAADLPHGEFTVRITENRRDVKETRVATHHFSIDVSKKPVALPVAQPLGSSVETLITIHDPERLALANKEWPIDVLLERAALSAHSDLDDKKKGATKPGNRAALYNAFLKMTAKAHKNDTLDPDSPTFDKAKWGNPADWKLIAVRPRLDKKWHEVRMVYKAKAHEASYAMFKFRPFADSDAPKNGLELNNKAMVDITLKAFFLENGGLDPVLFSDKKAHGKRVASFLGDIINYKAEDLSWHSATFLGLPMEARLGGGSVKGDDGKYTSGDGWGWHVMKAKPIDGSMTFKNIPIKGFATAVTASKDGKKWEMSCADEYDDASDAHDAQLAGLCRKSGHVDLAATGEGYTPMELSKKGDAKIVSSLVEAANMHIEHKAGPMVRTLPLRDPRRDLFEEKGMTCAQCHVRKFGVRDMRDKSAHDPSAGTPKFLNKKQATTYFVLTPTVSWQPYAIDFQYKQECKIKKAIESASGKTTSLRCPLAAE